MGKDIFLILDKMAWTMEVMRSCLPDGKHQDTIQEMISGIRQDIKKACKEATQ
jgi:hypothetical protein